MYEKKYRIQPSDEAVKKLSAATKRGPIKKKSTIKITPIGPTWAKHYKIPLASPKTVEVGTQTDFSPELAINSRPAEAAKPSQAKGYHCSCTVELFKTEDIAHRSSLGSTKYIFVRPPKTSARVDRNGKVRCENCDKKLGGFCNFQGDVRRPRLRCCENLLEKH